MAADDLMNLVRGRGYVVRASEAIEGIRRGDGWFALDYGDKERATAEAEINELIAGMNGSEYLQIEESGQLSS
jgi:hypothetical protein